MDDDCDGEVDEEASDAGVYWADADGDGYGGEWAVWACEAPHGYVTATGDCQDSDPAIHPGALHECRHPGEDLDCDGRSDSIGGAECADYYRNPGNGCAAIVSGATISAYEGAQDYEHYQLSGEPADPYEGSAGAAVAWVGDVDGDAQDDTLVTHPDNDAWESGYIPSAGRAYVVTAAELVAPTIELGSAARIITGVEEGGSLGGYDVAALGDVEGGGLADIAVEYDDSASPENHVIAVFTAAQLAAGGQTTLASDASATIRASAGDEGVGRYYSAIQDVDGDGMDEIAISNIGETSVGGPAAYILSVANVMAAKAADTSDARTRVVVESFPEGASCVLSAGDLDSDGMDDLALRDTSSGDSAGELAVVFGSELAAEGGEVEPSASIVGAYDGEAIGLRCPGVGDVDGRGGDDLLVVTSDQFDYDGGRALLLTGEGVRSGGTPTTGDSPIWWQGEHDRSVYSRCAGNADFDGDGRSDFAFGSALVVFGWG